MDREETLKILKERLSLAQRRDKEASAHFNEILREMASIPHPDGMTSFERAARGYRKALRELSGAQDQMAQFLLHSVVPSDLDRSRLN